MPCQFFFCPRSSLPRPRKKFLYSLSVPEVAQRKGWSGIQQWPLSPNSSLSPLCSSETDLPCTWISQVWGPGGVGGAKDYAEIKEKETWSEIPESAGSPLSSIQVSGYPGGYHQRGSAFPSDPWPRNPRQDRASCSTSSMQVVSPACPVPPESSKASPEKGQEDDALLLHFLCDSSTFEGYNIRKSLWRRRLSHSGG